MGHLGFCDTADQDAFASEGYFVRRIIDEATAKRLWVETEKLVRGKSVNRASDNNYYSVLDADPTTVSTLSELAWQAWAEPIEKIAFGWQKVQSSVLVKLPDLGGTPLHMHTPTTDRPFATSAVGWCALEDCGEEDGCLFLVPRSHRLIRHIGIQEAGFIENPEIAAAVVRDHAIPIVLKAGEAVFFDNSMLHGAYVNRSGRLRVAVGILIANASEDLADYQRDKNGILVTRQPPEAYATRVASLAQIEADETLVLRRLPNWRNYPNYAQIDALLRANGRRASEDYDPLDTVRHLDSEEPMPPDRSPKVASVRLVSRLRAAVARRAPASVKSAYRRLRGRTSPTPSAPNLDLDFAPYPAIAETPYPFANPQFDETLHHQGYVTFPFLDPSEVDRLAAAVNAAEGTHDQGDVHIPTHFRLSAFNNDSAYKERLYDGVWDCLKERVEALLPGFEPLVINLFDKQPGSGYDPVPIHQNPSFVDEPAHKSVSLWIPLDDVDKNNGTVGVLPGSHNRFNTMRAGNMAHEHIFAEVQRELEEELFVPIVLKKGEMLALDDSIIHWSYPNVSDRARVAVQLIMVPQGVPHIYYFYDDEAPGHPMMDLYEVDRHFFFGFNCKARPETLTKIGRVPYRYRPIARPELTAQR